MRTGLLLTALLLATPALLAQDGKPSDQPAAKQSTDKPAADVEKLRPKVKMQTNMGDIVIELYGDKCPVTVQNFLKYAQDDHYKNTIFHRVISDFMIQGGGFTPDLEEKTKDLRDPIVNEWRTGLKNERGTVAMARTNAPDSATAQFFINVVDNARLDEPISGGAGYCAFGKVVEGMDVVDKIKGTPCERNPKYPSPKPVTPKDPVIIQNVKIVRDCDESALNNQIQTVRKQQEAMQQAAQQEKEREVQDVVAKLEQETGKTAHTTDSGLMYIMVEEGSGESPKPTDRVTVHYTGKLTNGNVFDSSVQRGQPATFPLNRVIAGWTEGVGLMKVGGKIKLIIPPDLGYGQRGSPPVIPPNSWLIFDVELISIN